MLLKVAQSTKRELHFLFLNEIGVITHGEFNSCRGSKKEKVNNLSGYVERVGLHYDQRSILVLSVQDSGFGAVGQLQGSADVLDSPLQICIRLEGSNEFGLNTNMFLIMKLFWYTLTVCCNRTSCLVLNICIFVLHITKQLPFFQEWDWTSRNIQVPPEILENYRKLID